MITRRDLAARRLRIPDTTGWGVALAFVVALISGISVFANSYGVKQVPDPAVYTTLKNGVAALILIGFAALVVRGAEVRALAPGSWVKLGIIGIIGGSVPFILFFSGLAIASAPTAAFIHKTLFVWVAILAVPFLGERLGIFPIAALGVLLAGQFLAAPPTGVVWGIGETMILTATLLWGIEVVIAKRLLIADVPSPLVAAARLGIGLVVLVGYLGITGRLPVLAGLTATQLAWGVGTGALLAAYTATWLAALRRADASVVASVLVIAAPITAVLAAGVNGTLPAPTVALGLVIMSVSVLVLAAFVLRRQDERGAAPA
ncbi:MAG: EamA family transporter [Chloroflexota bacterium]